MAKPIVVAYVPSNVSMGARELSWGDMAEMAKSFEADKPDYHWLFLIDYDGNRIELKVFYEKDFESTTFEELKALITEKINQKNEH